MITPVPPAGGLRRLGYLIANSSFVRPRTQEERNVRWMYLNTSMLGVSLGGIASFLPVFLARLGASSSMMGWLNSAPGLIAVATLIPAAAIAERNPDQVKVTVIYAQIIRFFYLLCVIAPSVVPPAYLPVTLVALWTIKTIPETISMPAWTSVMARAVSPERRGRLNGTRWAMLSVVSAISSALFGWLLDLVAFPLNYQLVFLITTLTAMLDPLFFSRVRVPHLEKPQWESSRGPGGLFAAYLGPVLRHKLFLGVLAAITGYRVAVNLASPLFSLYWVNVLKAPDTLLGLRGTVGYAALVIGYLYWGRSANRLGHRKVLTISALGFALYPILTALSPSPGWLLPVAALWGLTVPGLDISLFDMMLGACPQQRQPLFAAVWMMTGNVAMFVGPLMGAALADATTLRTALLIAGVLHVVATLPFARLPKDI
jgi:MFS family permease